MYRKGDDDMKWHRPEYNEKVRELKEGDVVYLRTDIEEHKNEIECGYVSEHKEYQGEKVMIETLLNDTSYPLIFKILQEYVYFDTDMIDWEKTEQSKNGVNKLISWIK